MSTVRNGFLFTAALGLGFAVLSQPLSAGPASVVTVPAQTFPAGPSSVAGLVSLSTTGAVIVPSGAQVAFKAGSTITLTTGFSIQSGGTFTANLQTIDTDADGISDIVENALALNPDVANIIPDVFATSAPTWWATRMVTTTLRPADDYAGVNQGQLRNIAKKTYDQLAANLLGGAGATLDALWAAPAASSDDYRAVNIGQVKNIVKPFYDRMIALGYGAQYPWLSSPNPPDDYALANAGQVKKLFAGLAVDANNNAAPDYWEYKNLGKLSSDLSLDTDADGVSDYQEFLLKLYPTLAAQVVTPTTVGSTLIDTPLQLQVFTP